MVNPARTATLLMIFLQTADYTSTVSAMDHVEELNPLLRGPDLHPDPMLVALAKLLAIALFVLLVRRCRLRTAWLLCGMMAVLVLQNAFVLAAIR